MIRRATAPLPPPPPPPPAAAAAQGTTTPPPPPPTQYMGIRRALRGLTQVCHPDVVTEDAP